MSVAPFIRSPDPLAVGATATLTPAPTVRRVFIVVRGDVALLNYIQGRWSGHEGIEVVVDRRRHEQRRRREQRVPERRQAERRRKRPVDLRSVGWAKVLLPNE